MEFGADELTSSKSAIHSSINNTIFSLITEVKKQKLKLKKENVNKAQEIIDFNDIFNGAVKNIPFNLCAAFKSVWKDPVVQEVLLNSIFVDDNSISFLNDIERIIAEEYVPSNEDVLLSRSPTLVITETKLLVKTAKSARQVNFVDVGGQKSLRKAWIPYFDNMVTSIIFIASIAGYDEYLDDKKNIIVDATELFNEIINNQWFINLPAIILLNKIDLFEKKLHRAKIRDHFPDFKNHNNLQSGKEFFKLQFEKLVKNTSKRETFIRIYKVNLDFTKNTDRKLTKFVIEAVFNIIIDGNLSVL